MKKSSHKNRCCLVLGMHNSGTSLLAAILYHLGAPMGEHLLVRESIPDDNRPRYDYFEDREVVALQDRYLQALGRHWSSVRGSQPIERKTAARDEQLLLSTFEQQLSSILRERLPACSGGLWVVKDPRIPIFLESWLRTLHWLEIDPLLLVVHRPPGDNIASFSSKAGIPTRWAEALWQQTYVQIATHRSATADLKLLKFSQLLNPETISGELTTWLGLSKQPRSFKDLVRPELQEKRETPPVSAMSRQIDEALTHGNWPGLPALDDPHLESELLRADLTCHPQLQLNAWIADKPARRGTRRRVCLLTAEYSGCAPCGGIGTAMALLAEQLSQAGHSVEIWLAAPGITANDAAGLVRPIPPSAGESPQQWRQRLAKELLAARFDVIHLHDWLGLGAGLRAIPPSARLGTLLVCGLHGPTSWVRHGSPNTRAANDPAEQEICNFEADTIAAADLLLSPSRHLAEWIRDQMPQVVGNTPVLVQLNCPAPPLGALAKGDTPIARDSLVFFGRLEERKGLRLFIEALERLGPIKAPIHIVGSDAPLGNGLASHWLQQRLQKLGQPFHWHGQLSRKEAHHLLLRLGGVVVVPSLIENSPYSIQELLDSDLRVVATNVGGIAELVADGTSCLSPANAEDLAGHLRAALASADGPSPYHLRSAVDRQRVQLSWQAFHTLLPRPEPPQPIWDPREAILLITLDSCRYDTFHNTPTPALDRVGPLHRAQAPSYFTYGSHAAMFMGFLPGVTQTEAYVNSKYAKVFRVGSAGFRGMTNREAFQLEGNSMITGLRREGYATIGSGAVNWFDTRTETGRELTADFEEFWFAGNSWSLVQQLAWIDDQLNTHADRPPFVFLNVGETHVPYWHEGAPWSREDNPCVPFQRQNRRHDCKVRQAACLRYVDQLLEPMLEKFAQGTVIVCADHGDCWGENGLWEHGISHAKTLEVPLLMRVRGQPVALNPRRRWRAKA